MDTKKIANLLRLLADAFEEEGRPVAHVAQPDLLGNVLRSNDWPSAVDPEWICDETPASLSQRASSIVKTIVDESFAGKKFLDVGCGKGYCCDAAIEAGAVFACGYDTTPVDRVANNIIFAPDFQVVSDYGPYDIVLLYDVLDHAENPTELLSRVKGVLAPGGFIFVRCHPWTSRHGGHYFRTINKAYVHLVFSEQELKDMGYVPSDPTRRIIHPLKQYKEWFDGFDIVYSDISTQPIESFFSAVPEIRSRIVANWRDSHDLSLRDGVVFPDFQLSQQFVDYKLVVK